MLQSRTNQKVAVAVIYIVSMLMNSIDSTVVNVALPTLSREFGVSPSAIEGVIVGYLVSLAVFIPASGWLGDRFGYKRVFLCALFVFTLASTLCGFADSLNQLILFRVLQGAGGGCLTPVGMALLYRTFPPEERIGVSRILMFATIIGPASGPILGGLMIEHFSWRWIFFVNVPIGIAALFFGALCLQDNSDRVDDPFDFPGFILAGAGFAAFMYALSEGASHGWLSSSIVITGVVGILLLTAFVWVELHTNRPMVKLQVLGNNLFRTTMSVSFFSTAAFLGTLFAVPLFLQEGRGVSPLTSGLTVFPEAIGVVTSTQVVARVYPRIGPSRLMGIGLVWVAIVMTTLSFMPFDVSLWVFRGLMFALGCGMACIFVSNQAAALGTISRADTGRASMLMSVQRQIGAAFGVAVISSVLTAIGLFDGLEPNHRAYQIAFLTAAGIALVGAALSVQVPDKDAAITMRKATRRTAPADPETAAASSGG